MMALKDALPEAPNLLTPPGEEPSGDEEDPEASLGEEIQSPSEEVGIGHLLPIASVGILGDGAPSGPIGRVG